jgi:hypothetical protein
MSITYILNHYLRYVTSYEHVASVRVCIRMIYHRLTLECGEISSLRSCAANISSVGFGVLIAVVISSSVF